MAVHCRFSDDRGAAGFSWIVVEPMSRACHALASGGAVWLIDPLDWPDAIARATELGRPAAVVQLLDRHGRDCAAIAERLGIPLYVVPDGLPGSPFEVVPVLRRKRWQERALWWPAEETLVVAEAIGTGAFFPIGGDAAGTHPLLKPCPPRRQLGRFAPRHLLVGHGAGLHGDAAAIALGQALGRSRLSVLRFLVTLPGRAKRARAS
ncbi:MAG: hypothetical protein U0R50_10610 [Gaiellales bacterium]